MDPPRKSKNHRAKSLKEWWIFGTLCLSVILFVVAVYGTGDDNYLFRSYDFREIFTYQKSYFAAALLNGRFPLWNPHTFSGWPFAANPLVQAFYPTSLLYLILPQPEAVIVDLISHLLFGAASMFFLLRITFRLGKESAAFGAMLYVLSGSIVGHAFSGHIQFYAAAMYTPLLMLSVDQSILYFNQNKTSEKPSRFSLMLLRNAGIWFWLVCLIMGFQILSGGLPFVWLSLLLIGLYRLGHLCIYSYRHIHSWIREIVILVAIIGIALCLAAVQLVPTYELVQHCNRPFDNYDYAASGSYDPEFLGTMLFAGAHAPEDKHFWEYYGYMGILPIIAVAIILVRFHKDPRTIILIVIGIFTFLYMLGDYGPLFPFLWKYVPSFNLFRAPARSMVNLNFIIAILAALGLERIILALKQKAGAFLAAILPVFLISFAATWIDITISAHINKDRLFLPDPGLMESTVHKRHEEILKDDPSWYRFWFHFTCFRQNHAFTLKRHSIGGYDNMFMTRYSRFIHHMTDTQIVPSLVTILPQKTFSNAPGPFPFKILGLKYVDHKKKTYQQQSLEAIKRAWFVRQTVKVDDEEAALRYIRSDQFRPFEEVIFEAPEADKLKLPLKNDSPPVSKQEPKVEIRVHELSPEHLKIEISSHPGGFLVLSEIYYPGWYATIENQEIPVYRANSILRCIYLKENINQIDVKFRPASLRYGAFISLSSFLFVFVGLGVSCYSKIRMRR